MDSLKGISSSPILSATGSSNQSVEQPLMLSDRPWDDQLAYRYPYPPDGELMTPQIDDIQRAVEHPSSSIPVEESMAASVPFTPVASSQNVESIAGWKCCLAHGCSHPPPSR